LAVVILSLRLSITVEVPTWSKFSWNVVELFEAHCRTCGGRFTVRSSWAPTGLAPLLTTWRLSNAWTMFNVEKTFWKPSHFCFHSI